MVDAALVVLLVAFIWAAVLAPGLAGDRSFREREFLDSIRPEGHPQDDPSPGAATTSTNARHRQVLGGLAGSLVATLLLGLLPTFRLLLVVHLLLVHSCLAYLCYLVHRRDRGRARYAPARARIPSRTLAAPHAAATGDYYFAYDDGPGDDGPGDEGYGDSYDDDPGDDRFGEGYDSEAGEWYRGEDWHEADIEAALRAEAALVDDHIAPDLARPA